MFTPPDRPRGSIVSWFRSSWLPSRAAMLWVHGGPGCGDAKIQRTTGPRDHGTTGPRDHRTTGPPDHGTTGPRDHRTTGPSDLTLQLITFGGASYPAFARSFGTASRASIPGRFAKFGAVIVHPRGLGVRQPSAALFRASWTDWRVVHVEKGPFVNDMLGDPGRWKRDGVLSVMVQESPRRAHEGSPCAYSTSAARTDYRRRSGAFLKQ